jgi:predicted membrane channel-forming protein YqfA (hemolysin III family)
MKKQFLMGITTVLAICDSAHAANFAMITSPPTMFSFFVLVIAGFCLFGSFQVLNQVKGGMLSRSWQMFFLGFALLAISQLLNIGNAMEFFSISAMVVPGLLVLMAGVFAYGVYTARRTLS